MTTTFVMEQHPYLNWPAKKQQKQQQMIFSRGQNLPKSACRILFGEVEGHGTRTSSDDNCVKVSDSERCQVLHQFLFFFKLLLFAVCRLGFSSAANVHGSFVTKCCLLVSMLGQLPTAVVGQTLSSSCFALSLNSVFFFSGHLFWRITSMRTKLYTLLLESPSRTARWDEAFLAAPPQRQSHPKTRSASPSHA